MDQTPLQLEREGIKQRKGGERGGGGWWGGGEWAIIRGRRIFSIFPPKGGDCLREALNEGRLLFEEIQYM